MEVESLVFYRYVAYRDRHVHLFSNHLFPQLELMMMASNLRVVISILPGKNQVVSQNSASLITLPLDLLQVLLLAIFFLYLLLLHQHGPRRKVDGMMRVVLVVLLLPDKLVACEDEHLNCKFCF